MAGFLGEDPSGFLTEGTPASTTPRGEITESNRIEDISYYSGLTPEEASGALEANRVANLPISTSRLGVQGFEGVLQAMVDEERPLDELQGQLLKEEEIRSALRDMEDFTAVDSALAKDPQVAAALFKIEHRTNLVKTRLTDMAEEFKGGLAEGIYEFIDQMAYDTYANIRDIGSLFSNEGSEISILARQWQTALSQFDDDELQEFMNERMEFITFKDVEWQIQREIMALEAAGVNLWDEALGPLIGAASALDLATVGIGGASLLRRGGKSLVGRLRRTSGTEAATEAAEGTSLVLRGGLDGEIIDPPIGIVKDTGTPQSPVGTFGGRFTDDVMDAEIIEDIAPGFVASKVRPKGTKTPPPVSASAVQGLWMQSTLVKLLRLRESKFSFGASNLKESAEEWANRTARSSADASSTKVINVDLEDKGLQNFVASFTLGKQSGGTFKIFNTARKRAEEIPNAYIIDTRTGAKVTEASGSSQYAVKVDVGVPIKDLVSPLDLSEVGIKSGLMNFFGRSGTRSSTYLSNLADMGEFGFLGFKKDVEGMVKNLRKLGKDQKIIDDILTTLRDTPTKGSARSWLTTDEFVKSYKTYTGNYPSREVIRGYQDLIEMSDVSWYAAASERLSSLYQQGATVLKSGDTENLIFPSRRTVSELKSSGDFVTVWDAITLKTVSLRTVSDETIVYKFGNKVEGGASHVINFAGQTRLPQHADAFAYNAGGPRSNPGIAYFIGQSDNGWNTLMGARSEADANRVVAQFNNIVEEISNIGGDVASFTPTQRASLDNLILKNNEWNPEIETLDDFFQFTKDRGVPVDKRVITKQRNEKISSFTQVGDNFLLDMSVEQYISYARHDIPLMEFGGTMVSNPNPVMAITQQFNNMATRAAQTQYRMSHPTAWVKAVEKSMRDGMPADIPIHPMTDEKKVLNYEIRGTTETARKLRQEQDVIKRRLALIDASDTPFWNGASRSVDLATEALHNITPRKVFGKEVQSRVDPVAAFVGRKAKGTGNFLLSVGFMQRMAEPSQVFLQASHFIAVTAITPKNGSRAISLSGYIRQAARSGDASAWKAAGEHIRTAMGLSKQEADDLMEHVFYSGKGYMRGALAEDPGAAGLLKGRLGQVGDTLRIPYYAGENFSQTVARVAAYLDTMDSYPALTRNSRAFVNKVQERDRVLSFALNSAQKSKAQSGPLSRVVTQWTSYQLRTMESVFYPGVDLTLAERGRLAAATMMMWGTGGAGLAGASALIYKNLPEPVAEFLVNGVDVFFDSTLGIKVGERVAQNPIELMERGYGTFTDPVATIPALDLTIGTADAAYTTLTNVFSGRYAASSHSLERLLRTWKVVDSGVMAYTMVMEDNRRTRNGSSLRTEFTASQELFQALGISPSEAIDLSRLQGVSFSGKKRKADAISTALPVFLASIEAAQAGEYTKAQNLMLDADSIVAAYGLTEVYQAEVREELFRRVGFDKVTFTFMELQRQGLGDYAKQLEGLR